MSVVEEVQIGESLLTIEDVIRVAKSHTKVRVSENQEWRQKLVKSAAYLEKLWKEKQPIYGVTTGYGRSCDVPIPHELVPELPLQLSRFHGCGLGKVLSPVESRAVVITRAASFCRGLSGVRLELLERLCELLNHDLVPVIPSEGSVGASGDLTPLSYLAALIVGEREAYLGGDKLPAKQALEQVGLEPLTLLPKEGLAIMNGTSVMTALACVAYDRAVKLLDNAIHVSAANAIALGAPNRHFDPRFFHAKPFKGQLAVAEKLFGLMQHDQALSYEYSGAVQARYSIRCVPQILGVLADGLSWIKEYVEIELNSANDNPLIDGEEGVVFHGGHFYGGHLSFAMDSLKNIVANIADMLDRQLALLVDPHTNNGLPRNLCGAKGDHAFINHGYKAVQIGTSAWAAEALKNTIPASVFSRSTESHNQDKVSMGTISARDCLRNLELTEQVLAASMHASAQALDLRVQSSELDFGKLNPKLVKFYASVREQASFLESDIALDQELQALMSQF